MVRPPLRVPLNSYTTLACPPLSLAYLAGTLLSKGFDAVIVDAVGEDPMRMTPSANPAFLRVGLSDEELVERIPPDTRLIGITSMFSEEWPLVREVIRSIRRSFPSALLVAGGEHVTAAPEFSLGDCRELDLCVLGEGEATLAEIALRLSRGESVRDVAGTVVRENGTVQVNPPRPRIRDLDAIPPPAWHLVPLERYFERGLGFGLKRGRSIPILMSRGCPYRCSFCSNERMWTTRWIPRSPGAVIDEMATLIDRYAIDNFDVYDATATVRRDWVVEFCTRLIARGWNITWQIPAGTRTEVLDDEVTRLLHRSGCRYLAYAPESGSTRVLRKVRKRLDLVRMKQSMRSALRSGIRVKCNMIVGFPDETPAEMFETTRLCVELAVLGAYDLNMGPFCPYPGSAIFDELVAAGRIPRLDDDFFDALASYSDLGRTRSWNPAVPDWAMAMARIGNMALFYGISFVLHPGRLASLVKNLATGRQDTRLARALSDIVSRRKAVRLQ